MNYIKDKSVIVFGIILIGTVLMIVLYSRGALFKKAPVGTTLGTDVSTELDKELNELDKTLQTIDPDKFNLDQLDDL